MAVVFDSSSEGSAGGNSNISYTHTITASGSNHFLVVGVTLRGDTGAGPNPSVTSVTYAGDTLTQDEAFDEVVGSESFDHYVFYLAGPATGANTLTINISGGAGTNSTAVSCSFTGVDQNNPFGTKASSNADSNASVNLTSEEDELCVDVMSGLGLGETSYTEGAGQTLRNEIATGTGGARSYTGMSTEPGAASVTMSWTHTTADNARLTAYPIKPAAPPRGRIVKYLHNTFISRKLGKPQILDVLGRDIPVEQLEIDQWIYTDGPFFPSPRRYSSLIEEQAAAYMESIHTDPRGRIRIEAVKESILESIFRRLSRSA